MDTGDDIEFVATSGKQVFERDHTKITVEAVPLGVRDWAEKLPAHRCFNKHGGIAYTNSSTDNFPDHGKWLHSTYKYMSGQPVSLIAIRHQRYEKSSLKTDCYLNLLPSALARMIVVYAPLTPNRLSSMGDKVCVFRGRAYVCGLDELASLQVSVSDADIDYYLNPDEVSEEFIIETLSRRDTGSSRLPDIMEVVDEQGNKGIVLAKPEPGRRIRVRKK